MKKIMRRNRLLRIGVPTVLMAAGAVAMLQGGQPPADGFQDLGLNRILAADGLEVVTGSSARSFSMYGRQFMGFDDELARDFAGQLGIRHLDLKPFHEGMRSRLPRYRPFIKDTARKNGFDWRLIAAQAYQESRLDPLARGAYDAQGLMQILPATARGYKLADPFDPVANIKVGVQYLRWLYDVYEGVQEDDRLLMALAAYNVGPGHVQDARRLAARMGLDPNRWDSIATTLLLLRERRYYQDTEQGFCRGDITVAYVKHILVYYDILKRQELNATITKPVQPGAGGLENLTLKAQR